MVSDKLKKYYERSLERGAQKEVYAASRVGLSNESSKAVDLGCGIGIETEALLTRTWKVHAIDSEAEAIERLRSRVSGGIADNLTTEVGDIREAHIPHSGLVVAMNSFFSFNYQEVEHIAEKVSKSLCINGVFCVNLLSERDDWIDVPGKHTFKERDIPYLFEPFTIIDVSMREYSSSKFWSIMSILMKK